MKEDYEALLKMCNDLLDLFGWPEYMGSDIKFRKATVLRDLGRTKEAVEFCKEWMQKESENIVAATAGVYAFIGVKEYDEYVKAYFMNLDCEEDEELPFD